MNIRMFYVLSLTLLFISGLCSCEESPLQVAVRYSVLDNLRAQAPVYFDETRIGQIEKISSTDQGDYLVEININSAYRQHITEHTHFFIASDPRQEQGQVIRIEVDQPGGAVLKDGSIVQGQRKTFLDELMTSLRQTGEEAIAELKTSLAEGSRQFDQKLEESLDALDKSINHLEAELQGETEDDVELEQLQQLLDAFIAQFKQANVEVREQLREKLIPQLRQQLEKLKTLIQDDQNEEEIQRLEGSLDELVRV
jgi:paraquat-inducible protein B